MAVPGVVPGPIPVCRPTERARFAGPGPALTDGVVSQ
jgi:hypothetical protein